MTLDEYLDYIPDEQMRAQDRAKFNALPYKIRAVVRVNSKHVPEIGDYDNVGAYIAAMQLRQQEIVKWCEPRCTANYTHLVGVEYYGFEDEHDAVTFKLVWG